MINYMHKLFGYKSLFDQLVHLDLKNKLPSRILLTGQEGIGKSTFAFHFINYIFSKNEDTKYDLIKNKINLNSISYNLVKNLSHPNFFLISSKDLKKNIEIEQVRNMLNFLNKSTFDNKKKIVLIDNAEDLIISSSNALLKSLEEANESNLFLLTHNINRNLLDTISSRCLTFKLNFDYSEIKNIISEYFDLNLYNDLNDDFKLHSISPKFIINHVNFLNEIELDLKSTDIKSIIKYIIDHKSYKKNTFINNHFQNYIEIYFIKMYSETKEFKYYNNFIKAISENNLISKFNLDLDSFFIKFEKKYLNI